MQAWDARGQMQEVAFMSAHYTALSSEQVPLV